MSERLRRLGVFAAVFLVTVVLLAGAIAGGGGGSPAAEDYSAPVYTDDDLVASAPEETGSVEMSAEASDAVVLIDAGHGNAPTREELEPLVTTLTRNGATVEFFSGTQRRPGAFNATLRRADAFVAFGAEQSYTEGQLAGIETFADAGGRVLLLKEPPQQSALGGLVIIGRPASTGAPAPMTALASQFGIAFGNGYLYDMAEYDNNYRNVYATPAGSGDLAEGVDRLVLHESTPVVGGAVAFETTETAELSETRRAGPYAVVTRSGNVVAVGDASVVSQDFATRADNEVFVGNLLDFLVSGQKIPENAPAPPAEEGGLPVEPRPTPAP